MRETIRDGLRKRWLAAGVSGRVRRLLAAAIASVVVGGALGSTMAYAAPPSGPTRGDARGVFQAFFTGGAAIRAHNHLAEGVPGVPAETTPDGARIYPGLHNLEYCEQGWHVIVLGIFDDPAFFGGNRELFDYLSDVEVRFVLDGVPLETERTAIKRLTFPDPAFIEEAFAVNFGAFLPPGSLSVGAHQVQTIILDPIFGDFEFATAFNVVAC